MERLTKKKSQKLPRSSRSNVFESLYSREVAETIKEKNVVYQRTLFVLMTMVRH